MVTHVSFIEIHAGGPRECVEAIRERLELGWQLCQVRGPKSGPFALIFRMDDAPA